MNNISTIFDRILIIIQRRGIRNVAELASFLGYSSPQKIYRLRQAENSKPSYDIIQDFSKKFEDLNMRWFITGEGEPFITPNAQNSLNIIAEPAERYQSEGEIESLKSKIAELEIEKRSLLLALREVGSGHTPNNPTDNSNLPGSSNPKKKK